MATSTAPYHWLKRISPDLLKKDTIPLLGYPPPFPWDKLSQHLLKLFQLKELSIKPSPYERKQGEEIYAGFGSGLSQLTLSIAPIDSQIYWIMAQEDIMHLLSILLENESESQLNADSDIITGFYHFLALEVINALPQINFDNAISVHINENTQFPQESCLCIEVQMEVNKKSFWGRLILPDDFQNKWKERYAKRTVEPPLSNEVELVVNLQAGKTSLTLGDWKKVHEGDFLLLDSCSLTAQNSGKVTLTVDGTALFIGEIQNGKINIIETPLHQEVAGMSNTLPPEDELFDISNEPDHPEENQDQHDEEIQNQQDEDIDEFEDEFIDEDEEGLEKDIAPPITQEKWPPPPEKRPEKNFLDFPKGAPTTPPSPSGQEKQPIPSKTHELKETISPEEIPLNIVVEVGRFQMSVQKLMELQPGNILDLNVHPEEGVNLTVNGKRIAKGELLLVGDILGIRVLDVG